MPGRRSAVEVGAAASVLGLREDVGRRTRAAAAPSKLCFDDYRVVGLRDLLGQLGSEHPLRPEVVASADRRVAGRATRWQEPLSGAATPDGAALRDAAERHAITLCRRATDAGGADVRDPAVQRALQQRGAGEPLPEALRQEMEQLLHVSLARARVHTDDVAARAAQALHAEAFTLGDDIFFAAGAYAPASPAGRKLIAHELAHVAQGQRGETASGAGLRVSEPGEPLEREAEAVADRLASPPKRDPAADRAPDPKRAGAPRSAGDRRAILRSPAQQPPADADPQHDPHYVDNLIERVECTLLVADRYVLRWSGGHALIFNADIDWTKTSKALPVLAIEPGASAARARAAEWQDVATSGGYERAVAYYRGEGGAILPTWFSPETTPQIHKLILAVGHKIRERAHDAEDAFRGLRNGMIIGAIVGGSLQLLFRAVPFLRGGRGAPAETQLEPSPAKPAETPPAKQTPLEPPTPTKQVEAEPPAPKPAVKQAPPTPEQIARSAAGNARARALAKHTFAPSEVPAVSERVQAAAQPAAQQAYDEAIAAGKTPQQANDAANRAAMKVADAAAEQEAQQVAREAAKKAIASRTAIDTDKIGTDGAQRMAQFEAGTRAPNAKRLAEELSKLNDREFHAKMASEPCTSKTVNMPGPPPHKMTVYEYTDGTVVRYKTDGAPQRPGPTYSVEVKADPKLPDVGKAGVDFKLDASGNPVPKGPYEVKNPYQPGSAQAKAFEQAMMNAGHLSIATDH